jgi:hypothetical protein
MSQADASPSDGMQDETAIRIEQIYRSYQDAAAVLTFFDPGKLQPVGSPLTADGTVWRRLLDDTRFVVSQQSGRAMTLKDEVRREVLKRLGTRDAMKRALAANPQRPNTLLQRTLEDYIAGTAKPLTKQQPDELVATLQVINWLDRIAEGLPRAEDVRSLLERESLFKPLKDMTGHFKGRSRELAELHDYVRRSGAPPPKLVIGVQGIGKSSLLAKLLLEIADYPGDGPIPFVYLDFERPSVIVYEPLTLLAEMARQIAAQSDRAELRKLCHTYRHQWLRLRLLPAESGEETSQSRPLAIGSHTTADIAKWIKQFAGIHARLKPADQFVLVLDGFEEIQLQGGAPAVAQVWSFLRLLQEDIPQLRTVIAGQRSIEPYQTSLLHLGNLTSDAAVQFLRSYGLTVEAARQAQREVRGNPLSLSLVSALHRRKALDLKGILNPQSQTGWCQPLPRHIVWWETCRRLAWLRWLPARLPEQFIQCRLYARLVECISNPDVQMLAQWGVVVRRITPDVIRHVLAETAGLIVENPDQAKVLFDELQRQTDFMATAEDGSIHHIRAIRGIMYDLLRRSNSTEVAHIHQAAITYYSQLQHSGEYTDEQFELVARAEEIFHRMRLSPSSDDRFGDEQRLALDKLFSLNPGVETYLRNALDELPRAERNYLAGKVDLLLEPVTRAHAAPEDWERQVQGSAQALVRLGDSEQALTLIHEREDPYLPGSRLYLIEAKALDHLGMRVEARRMVEQGIESAAGALGYLDKASETRRMAEQGSEPTRPRPTRDELRQRLRDMLLFSVELDERLKSMDERSGEVADGATRIGAPLIWSILASIGFALFVTYLLQQVVTRQSDSIATIMFIGVAFNIAGTFLGRWFQSHRVRRAAERAAHAELRVRDAKRERIKEAMKLKELADEILEKAAVKPTQPQLVRSTRLDEHDLRIVQPTPVDDREVLTELLTLADQLYPSSTRIP